MTRRSVAVLGVAAFGVVVAILVILAVRSPGSSTPLEDQAPVTITQTVSDTGSSILHSGSTEPTRPAG